MIVVKNILEQDVNERLESFRKYMNNNEILLFQEYLYPRKNVCNEILDMYFEDYCDEVIYYYDSSLEKQLENSIKEILSQNINCEENMVQEEKNEYVEKIFTELKKGDIERIETNTLIIIKKLVYSELVTKNYNKKRRCYILDRIYGQSKWSIDENGIHKDDEGVVWYKPNNRDEYIEIMNNIMNVVGIAIKEGDCLEDFSKVFVVVEGEESFDLLIYENMKFKYD